MWVCTPVLAPKATAVFRRAVLRMPQLGIYSQRRGTCSVGARQTTEVPGMPRRGQRHATIFSASYQCTRRPEVPTASAASMPI